MDIAAWLRELGLERYEEAFRENEIDAEILPKLTADDLKDIGVTTVGHRRKLLEAIAALAEPASAAAGGTERPSRGRTQSEASEAERRQLTVLFCDLVGSTELSARLDPEDMGAVIRAYQDACAEVVERWGGHVAKYMGDGVLAYFGWPQAHEDDAERAVRAGLATGRRRSAQLETPAGAPLAARVGIATGLVMVGELIGEGAAQEQSGGRRDAEPRGAAAGAGGAGQRGRSARRRAGWSAACSSWPTSARSGSRASPSRSRPGGSKARVAPRAASRRCTASVSRRWSGASTSSASCSSAGPGPRTATARWCCSSGEPGIGKSRVRPDAARAPRRRAVHAAQPLLLAVPHQQRAPPGDRPAGAGGAARSRRAAGGAAGQARGAARARRATGWTRSCPCSPPCSGCRPASAIRR